MQKGRDQAWDWGKHWGHRDGCVQHRHLGLNRREHGERHLIRIQRVVGGALLHGIWRHLGDHRLLYRR